MLRVDQASFQTEVVEGSFDQPVFIAFAPTTGPVPARLDPLLAALEAEHPGALKVVRVDPAEQPEIAAACGVGDRPEVVVVTAGTGVAMGNAIPQIKTIASFVTKSNNEDGVAWAIDKIIADNQKEQNQ